MSWSSVSTAGARQHRTSEVSTAEGKYAVCFTIAVMKCQESYVVVVLVPTVAGTRLMVSYKSRLFCQDCVFLGISAVHGRVMSLTLEVTKKNPLQRAAVPSKIVTSLILLIISVEQMKIMGIFVFEIELKKSTTFHPAAR